MRAAMECITNFIMNRMFGEIKELDTSSPRECLRGFEPFFKVHRCQNAAVSGSALTDAYYVAMDPRRTPDDEVAEAGRAVIEQLGEWFKTNYPNVRNPESRFNKARRVYMALIETW